MQIGQAKLRSLRSTAYHVEKFASGRSKETDVFTKARYVEAAEETVSDTSDIFTSEVACVDFVRLL